MITETIKKHTLGSVTITVDVVNFCQGSDCFNELYTATDEHQAGTTVQIPSDLQDRCGPKFVIGQYKPSELAKSYAKQGRENPSRDAYASLQKELRHYIEAQDCSLRCTIEKAGIELAETYGISFEHSHVYGEDLGELGAHVLKDYGMGLVREAVAEAKAVLERLAA